MIEILVHLLVLCLILGLVYWALMLLPIPAPFRTVIQVVFAIICILVLLSAFGGTLGLGHYGW